MKTSEVIHHDPIATERTVRAEEVRVLTSCRAGKIIPLAYIPSLREDSIRRGDLRVQLKMDETIHPLMNAVHVTVYAHFVPFTAFERFRDLGLDSYNRAYQAVPEPQTGNVIPYFREVPFNGTGEFWKTMGIHWKEGEPIIATPVEAYNCVVNFRRKARSKHLPLRGTETAAGALASAFWKNPRMAHIVADFDDAAMDGEVELQWTHNRLPVTGIGRVASTSMSPATNQNVRESNHDGSESIPVTYRKSVPSGHEGFRIRTLDGGTPEVFAELAGAGVRVSLANIELAKQTAAFAKLRERYEGLDDDHIIDLLMEGIRVPDEGLKQPVLLDRKSTVFGYSERHATDGPNLEKSVTTGQTEVSLRFRTPPMNVEGCVIVTCEIVPDQLFERQKDLSLEPGNPNDNRPNFMRDYLDPQKVQVVRNDYVDVEHSNPNGTFGYAPLNHHWKRSITRVGGKYRRPLVDSFIEDRQRFWSLEQLNPTLNQSHYLVPQDLPHTVFADMLSDPFEILVLGNVEIVGNTQFGQTLSEDEGHYDHIMGQVDRTRLKPNA